MKGKIKRKVIMWVIAWSVIPPLILFVLTITFMPLSIMTLHAIAFYLFASFALYFMIPYIGLWLIGIGIISVYYFYKWRKIREFQKNTS